MCTRCLLAILCLSISIPLRAQVVINEIFYHAANNLEDLQWVELYNTADKEVNLEGWKLSKAVKFTFPPGATIPAHGYQVLCRNQELFQQFYNAPVAGKFEKNFKKHGERLDLRDAAENLIDCVEFSSKAPWPTGPHSLSTSLEKICPTASGGLPQNWSSSPKAAQIGSPAGTPGEQNASYSALLPPIVDQVVCQPVCAKPNETITIQARVRDEAGLKDVTLHYRVIGDGAESEEKILTMSPGTNQTYTAAIPGQRDGHVVRYQIHAVNQKSITRVLPNENEPRPAFSCLVQAPHAPGKIPLTFIIHSNERNSANADGQRGPEFDMQAQMRNMALSQMHAFLDLSTLWASLTLNDTPPEDILKLRPAFSKKAAERDQMEKTLLASTNYVEAVRKIPAEVQTFKTALGEELKPLLNPSQTKAFETWRKTTPRGGIFNRVSGSVTKQFAPFESDYLQLSASTNVTDAQFLTLREVYRDAIQKRDAMGSEIQELMNGNDSPQVFAKIGAIRSKINKQTQAVLSADQMRKLSLGAGQSSLTLPGMNIRKSSPREKAAFVYMDSKSQAPQLFDFVYLTRRHGGYKVHFNKDQRLDGMPVINLSFKNDSARWSLTEPLSYELHRRAGLDVGRIDYARLWIDNTLQGYCLCFEQPNKAFFKRIGFDGTGTIYKGTYRGGGLEGQNTKKSQNKGGHDDLIDLVGQLEQTKSDPDAQWAIIRKEFDAEKLISHYAARLLLSDWDGFFNNYYLYHDANGAKKWTLYVWDQDKTWGDYDRYPYSKILYDMPLTFGAEGDKPPGWSAPEPPQGFMVTGGAAWWRPGGWISKPVLANPIFRIFLMARIKELLNTEFTEEQFLPRFAQLKDRLQEDVRLRAEANNSGVDQAQNQFDRDLASLKEFLIKRREWLLKQPEIVAAGPLDRAKLQ